MAGTPGLRSHYLLPYSTPYPTHRFTPSHGEHHRASTPSVPYLLGQHDEASGCLLCHPERLCKPPLDGTLHPRA